ncbi:MAG: McbB family protein [Magnetospirillum sp.]|nr:McbB family protein [Magnetospirillum sp.]
MAYFVRPFTIQHTSPGTIIFAASGVHSLTSEPMLAIATELAEKQGTVVDDVDVGAIIARNGLEQQAAIDFLREDIGLLISTPSAAKMHGDVLVITDLPRLGGMLAECLALPRSYNVQVKGGDAQGTNTPSCVVLAMGDYCAERVHALYAEYARRPGIAILTAYLFRHLLLVDGPFIPSRGLPCHFCHQHHFARGESRRWSVGDGSWISAKHHLEQKGIAVPAEIPITAALEGMMAFSLKHEIESLLAIGRPPASRRRCGHDAVAAAS